MPGRLARDGDLDRVAGAGLNRLGTVRPPLARASRPRHLARSHERPATATKGPLDLEAIIGAVYLDAGYREAQRIVHNAYGARLLELPDAAELRDPKTRLQELLQSRKIELPAYDVHSVSGKAHQQTFIVSCNIQELKLMTRGEGLTRRDAEQQAARDMLEQVTEAM